MIGFQQASVIFTSMILMVVDLMRFLKQVRKETGEAVICNNNNNNILMEEMEATKCSS